VLHVLMHVLHVLHVFENRVRKSWHRGCG